MFVVEFSVLLLDTVDHHYRFHKRTNTLVTEFDIEI